MQINLLEKTLQNVDRDACPKIVMFIFLKIAMCEKVSMTRNKIGLVFYAICEKNQPSFAGLSIAVGPCERKKIWNTPTRISARPRRFTSCVSAPGFGCNNSAC